ncbi:MAG: LysM peptidoglycan-binding domain-containing protein [Anaerolineaceae bacterium]|nr:MAG: LysM peptidoglycan-binding domain-containing protein [Anaerolineaceae bacterium]
MLQKRFFPLLTLVALLGGAFVLLSAGAPATLAQNNDNNLLVNPGFEDGSNVRIVAQGDGVSFAVFNGWEGWYVPATANSESWQNAIPNGTGRNNAGFGFVRNGNRSMELSRGWATFTAAVYQTVTVPENANVIGSAWVVMNISGDRAPEANSIARVGIDPTGGTNPLSSNVVWSSTVTNALASGGWRQMTANATAQGTRVTLFLYATQTVPTEGNGVFWDDASLVVGGGGSTPAEGEEAEEAAPPPPPPPAVVPFVSPQSAQDDGSIRHTVNEGDTLSSIAVAYGVQPDDIRELNPEIGRGQFLMVGQVLLIRRPTSGPTSGSGVGPSAPMQPVEPEEEETVVEPPQEVVEPQQPVMTLPSVRINTLYYFTNDLDAMREFYGTLIGLEEVEVDPESSAEQDMVMFDLGGVQIAFLLTEDEIAPASAWARQPKYDGGSVDEASLLIGVTDTEFEAIVGRVAGGGVTVYNDAILVPREGQRAIFVRDPNGSTIGILTEPEQG